MSGGGKGLLQSTSGAVAPTVALSLFGLIAAGGIAFDYARMAGLDSELQNAADQAALAAATQLDGKTGACSRAASAASALVRNDARFANDGNASGLAITVANEATCDRTGFIKFYKNKDRSDTGTLTDADVNFVEVTVNSRTARFALTPIVAMFSSGPLSAKAYAGVGGAICKVPPVMMCNPAEGTGQDFPLSTDIGKGIRLVAGGSGGTWAPGNFGYLETNLGSGANVLEAALGANVPGGDCISADQVTTKPGLSVSVTDAVNTRFDIYENGLVNYCASGSGNCSPALNTRKDVVRPDITSNGNGNGNGNGSALNCSVGNGTDPWQLPSAQYLPDPVSRVSSTPSNMGFPRDICHAVSSTGDCANGRIGDGLWDRALYFQVNHPGISPATVASWAGKSGISNLTRYDVYRWEQATSGALAPKFASAVSQGNGNGNTTNYYSYSAPVCATGVAPSAQIRDRRILSVAVVNCAAQGVQGQTKNVQVEKFVDVFLVEPSLTRSRTDKGDIYVEIKGEAEPLSETGAAQAFLRNVPYLIE
ncbi:hypothetical protein MRBLMA1_000777 [Sphingobium sp. LMA1-1-1.1]|uniref:pilus assembly protein TadG-related protein n=1 Tax=Sphingobium sp. LMA1-1-1.1 TaxID=3135238 RepID=UPI00342911B4